MKRFLRSTAYIFLALSILILGWSLKGDINADPATSTPKTTPETKKLTAAEAYVSYINELYEQAGLREAGLDFLVFRKAITGYLNLKEQGKVNIDKGLISVVDFNKPSTQKRLWIVDLFNKKLILSSLVAHGQGSGDNLATTFSNTAESHQSSLGFYITSETYQGKHGLSLRLNGMDEGYNTNALNRAVVVHGADYVSEQFIKNHGRLGRSYGCPAVPVELNSTIINTIKGKTMLYINGPDNTRYSSAFLNEDNAAGSFRVKTTA